ncbi:hypothetical protein Celly_0352 [Cellulophaga lytica DSM 7489]|uniref:Four helix bundle protein n=1 Tax=Cellulophaga lytica (strain ATCC 23178 / DSM 7489 / JCM 8516 / NBRC 14961 / NCIMB 1423 / VKM B-1433 / Cy l20) TaxID=867900 RepID=F0RHS8_CELLC|nr:hypothetical protein [Cellulophaga lytica]ADY28187.1 hypothetical protein Celly_0352 [Cellulophaga lytica DSM 7489]WQG77631.1 hypothetical protein SR888_01610 [Cellulophaga lytica]
MPYRNLNTVPVYKKALSLCHTSRELASYFSYNKDLLQLYKSSSLRDIMANSILTDAILLPIQIEQAERSDCKHTKLHSIKFINTITRNILSYCNGLEHHGVKEKEYLNLLRTEITSFRKSYKNWRRSLR